MTVPAKTQLILVHDQDFSEPRSTEDISELSADGGKVRLRVPKGQKSEGKDYKAIVSEAGILASFNQNDIILNWANKQPLAKPVTCQTVMDMMECGIYLRKSVVNTREEKFSIGTIEHENLQKVGGSIKGLKQAEAYLWKGNIESAAALFTKLKKKSAVNFCKYE